MICEASLENEVVCQNVQTLRPVTRTSPEAIFTGGLPRSAWTSGGYIGRSEVLLHWGDTGGVMRNQQTVANLRAITWNTTLSSRQRVLLHAQPIMLMRQHWAMRDDHDSQYDPMCLSMKLFDVVIDQSGFGNEVVRQTIADALFPLLESLDIAAQTAPDEQRHQRVVDRLLDGLLNETHHGQSFNIDYSEFDESGGASRKTLAFKLLKEVHGYSGEVVLQLSSEAINFFLNALDLDIESEQIANEAVVQYQLDRGKYDKARASAENARGQSLRYQEKIERIIEQTKRDIQQVKWREEVHGILVEALEHVRQRLKTEDSIIRSATEKLDAMDEADEKRQSVSGIVHLMKDCRYRHLNLNKLLMSARGEFLEQQSRQCFLDVSVFEVVNLRDDVLGTLLLQPSQQVLTFAESSGHALLGPSAPQILSLAELVRWQLQPRRPQNLGEVPTEEIDLFDTNADLHRFDEDVLRDAGKVFAELNRPIRLSELLTNLDGDGCPVAVQDAVILEVLDYFDPEDERDAAPFDVQIAAAHGLTHGRCYGDDLWIEPVEEDL